MANDEGLKDRDDAWVRAHGAELIQRLRAGGSVPMHFAIRDRLARLGDPDLLRELFLAISDVDVFEHAPAKAAADVLLSFPKGSPSYDLAVRRSARVVDARLLPLYADGLKIPRFDRSSNLFFALTGRDHPDVLRVVLDFLAEDLACKPEDRQYFETERIHLTRHVFKKAVEASQRGVDFPKEVHEALARARQATRGRDRCMLTMAGVALGRAEGVEDLAEGLPGCMWEQETWYEPLCRSRNPEVVRFVARMVAEDRLFMHKALQYNPDVASLILEEARKVPLEARLHVVSLLAERATGAVGEDARRLLEEMKPALLLPAEFPLRTKTDLVARASPTRVVVSCAGCGGTAITVDASGPGLGHVWSYSGPFRQDSKLDRAQSLAFIAALPAGSPAEVAGSLRDRNAIGFQDMEPCCRACGLAYCKACWKTEQTGTSGGSDIGVWYADYSATCPKGHVYTYNLITQSYG